LTRKQHLATLYFNIIVLTYLLLSFYT